MCPHSDPPVTWILTRQRRPEPITVLSLFTNPHPKLWCIFFHRFIFCHSVVNKGHFKINYDLITNKMCSVYSNFLQSVSSVHPHYSPPLGSQLSCPFHSRLASSQLSLPSSPWAQAFTSKFNRKKVIYSKRLDLMGRKDILQIPDRLKKNPKLVGFLHPKLKMPIPCYCNNLTKQSPHFIDLCNAHSVHNGCT